MKILVAEDDPAIAESYRLILEAGGHEVVVTKDGEECLEVFKKYSDPSYVPFDLIILDYRMPKKNGVQVAVQVRSEAPTQRILLATAYAHDLSIVELHKNASTQSVELIQKPFELDQFLSVIENVKQLPSSAHGNSRNNDKNASRPSSQLLPSGATGDSDDQKYGFSSMQDDRLAGDIFGIWE